jgi:hypothetical protein
MVTERSLHCLYLLPVLLVLYGIDGTAWLGGEREVELVVLAEAARIAQERVLLVVVDRPGSERHSQCPIAGLKGHG